MTTDDRFATHTRDWFIVFVLWMSHHSSLARWYQSQCRRRCCFHITHFSSLFFFFFGIRHSTTASHLTMMNVWVAHLKSSLFPFVVIRKSSFFVLRICFCDDDDANPPQQALGLWAYPSSTSILSSKVAENKNKVKRRTSSNWDNNESAKELESKSNSRTVKFKLHPHLSFARVLDF